MENSAYHQNLFNNSSNNSLYNPRMMKESNWTDNYSNNNPFSYSYKTPFISNYNELTARHNYIDNEQNQHESENICNKQTWSNVDVPTSNSLSSWGIMLPMQIPNNNTNNNTNSFNKSVWSFDLSQIKNNSSSSFNQMPMENIERSLSKLNVDEYSAKKTWAVVVGNSNTNPTRYIKNSSDFHRNEANSKLNVTKSLKFNEIPPEFSDIMTRNARFFVIKSYSEDDVYRSMKYQIWCSTEAGNSRLDAAFSREVALYLLFSVNGSGHFCGVAQMLSRVDYRNSERARQIWACQGGNTKWKGQFRVRWLLVKDVPNNQLRHIRIETNENKPVTNSRDVTEIPLDKGRQVMKIIVNYKATSSIYDDFQHYEQRELSESAAINSHNTNNINNNTS